MAGFSVFAQDLESAIKFVQSESQRAVQFPDLPPCEIILHTSIVQRVSEGDIAALRREIARNPSHPLAQDIDEIARSRQMLDEERWQIWLRDVNNWRWNSDRLVRTESPFSDIVMRDAWAWMSSHRELALFDTKVGFPVGRDVSKAHGFFSRPLAVMLHGAADHATNLRPDHAASGLENGMATIRFAGSQSIVSARWSPIESRWFIDFVSVPAEKIESRFEMQNWRFEEALASWIPRAVNIYSSDGSLRASYVFESAQVFSDSYFEEITTTPNPRHGDAIRGMQPEWARGSSIASIRDYRNNPAKPSSASAAPALANSAPPQRRTDWLLYSLLGCGVLAAVAAALVARFKAG